MCAEGREVKVASCGLAGCADKKELERDRKGEAGAQGKFFPLTAAQRFDASTNENENGVFLGHVASLTFRGPYGWQKVGIAHLAPPAQHDKSCGASGSS
jgi:hypothetical protein